MLSLALDAAHATDGLVTPAVGGAVLAAGYDRDFSLLSPDGGPVEPAAVPPFASLVLGGVILIRCGAVDPRPERRRQGENSRRRARAARRRLGLCRRRPRDDPSDRGRASRGRRGHAGRRGACDEQHRETLVAARRRAPASPDRSGDRSACADLLARRDGRRADVPGGRCRREGCAPARRRGAGVARRAWLRRPVRRPRRRGADQPNLATASRSRPRRDRDHVVRRPLRGNRRVPAHVDLGRARRC